MRQREGSKARIYQTIEHFSSIKFGGHEALRELEDIENYESSEEDEENDDDGDEETGLNAMEDVQATNLPENKSKKAKKKGDKKPPPSVIPLPTIPLRHLRKAGGTAHVVFNNSQSLAAVLGLPASSSSISKPSLTWPRFKTTSAAEPLGLAHYVAEYRALRPPLTAIREHADSSMEVYEYKLEQETKRNNSKYRKGEAIVDEDGFTLVTRGGAYGQTLGGGVGVASKKFMSSISTADGVDDESISAAKRKKLRKQNKEGLYAFQMRERRIKEQIALKKSYEQDKERIENAQKARKFKPY